VRIASLHRTGQRDAALRLFRELLPVLTYTNQEIRTSIAFFKELLVRKGIFRTATMRGTPFAWDQYNRRIAEELIDLYLVLEARAMPQD
jgi:4-hydroxy-tetrahydrodipicolinate synthase